MYIKQKSTRGSIVREIGWIYWILDFSLYLILMELFGPLYFKTDVVNTTCAATAQLSSFPHSKSLFIIENVPFQVLKTLHQLQLSLFRPITN